MGRPIAAPIQWNTIFLGSIQLTFSGSKKSVIKFPPCTSQGSFFEKLAHTSMNVYKFEIWPNSGPCDQLL